MSLSFSLFWEEIDSMVHIWYIHVIRPSQKQVTPSGKPIVMFHLPHICTVFRTNSKKSSSNASPPAKRNMYAKVPSPVTKLIMGLYKGLRIEIRANV